LARINNKTKLDIKTKALTWPMSRTPCVQAPDVEPTIWYSLMAALVVEARSPNPKQGSFLRNVHPTKENKRNH